MNICKEPEKSELELLDNKKNTCVEKRKSVIVKMIYHNDEVSKVNDFDYIGQKIGYNNIFLDVKEGHTTAYFVQN